MPGVPGASPFEAARAKSLPFLAAAFKGILKGTCSHMTTHAPRGPHMLAHVFARAHVFIFRFHCQCGHEPIFFVFCFQCQCGHAPVFSFSVFIVNVVTSPFVCFSLCLAMWLAVGNSHSHKRPKCMRAAATSPSQT